MPTDKLFAERGLRGDDEDLVFGGADLRATATGGEEVECGGRLRFCGVVEGDQGTEVDGFVRLKVAKNQALELGEGGLGLGDLPALARGKIGKL